MTPLLKTHCIIHNPTPCIPQTQPGVDCPPFPPPGPMLAVIAGESEEGVGEGEGESDEENGNEDNDGHIVHHYLHGFCLHGCCKQGEGVSEGEGGMGVGGGEGGGGGKGGGGGGRRGRGRGCGLCG